MSETRKIKVKNVRVADRQMPVNLESTDTGTFPTQVRVDAQVTGGSIVGSYAGTGQASGGGIDVVVVVQFSDPNFPTQGTLNYALTVFFSSGGQNWVQLPAADVTEATGAVTIT